MTTERLYEFTILANTLNFSKAANQLYISQPVLSKHMKELEKELGTTLFLRNTHGVTITRAGKILQKSSIELIRETNRLNQLVQSSEFAIDGQILVAFSEQTLCTPILEFLNIFIHKYPNISMNQTVTNINQPPEILSKYDIVFSPCEYTNLPDYIKKKTMMSQSAVLVYPPHPNLPYGEYIALEDLQDENIFVPFSNETFGPFLRNALMAERLSHGHVNPIGVNSVREGLLLVEQQKGLMILPHHLQKLAYRNSRIVGIKNPECKFDVNIYLNDSNGNSAARLLYESAVNTFN